MKCVLKCSKRVHFIYSFLTILLASIPAFADPLIIKVPAPSSHALSIGQLQLSLPQALLMARRAREQNPKVGTIIIELGAGIHRLSRPVEVKGVDSGTSGEPLIIRAEPGTIVRVLGSRPVFPDQIEISDLQTPYLAALPAVARSKMRVISLNEDELPNTEPRNLNFRQRIAPIDVFQNTRPLTMARWPKIGFERSQSITTAATKEMGPQFGIPFDKGVTWSQERSLWAGGYWGHDFYFETAPVSAIDPKHGVTLYPLRASYPVRPGLRYFIYNALSELDEPGRYVVDWAARRLVVFPYGDDLSLNPIEIASAKSLINIRDASHVKIEGIAFENARGNGIRVRDGVDVVLQDCLVANVGGNGIIVNGGQRVHIVRSVIADVGEAGIILSGGNRATLTPSEHLVSDSVIVRFGRHAHTGGPGLRLEGVGQTIERSYIGNAPYMAIVFDGNDHRIIGNEIAHVVQEASDVGAIYAGRDWTSRGTLITENYIHDIAPVPGTSMDGIPYDVKGVYFDDLLSGNIVRRNLFVNVMQPVFIGGGRDNNVTANIFVNPGNAAIHIDDRGLNWYASDVADPNGSMRQSLASVPYQAEPYRSRYSSLANILENEPGSPKNNQIGPNIVVGGTVYEMPLAVMRRQKLGQILDERTIGVSTLIANIRNLSRIPTLQHDALAPPFDLPFASMERKRALNDLKFITRSLTDVSPDGR
jgi:hypothetical protein